MLVLSRKVGESIVIGGHVTLTVSRVIGNRVALAFDAPRQVQIRRSELPSFCVAGDSQGTAVAADARLGEKSGDGDWQAHPND